MARAFQLAKIGAEVHLAKTFGVLLLSGLVMGAGAPPALRLPPPPEGAAFAVLSRSPHAEIKFHDVYIESARQNPGLNEIALDFTRPIEAGLIARLPAALPGWIEYAESGYDSAVIKTRIPANFTVIPVPDGFLLRFEQRHENSENVTLAAQVARLDANEGNLPQARAALNNLDARYPQDPYVLRTRAGVEASVGDWRAAERYYALAQAAQPYDGGLRGSLADIRRELGPSVTTSLTYTRFSGEEVVTAAGRVDYPVYRRLGVLAEIGVSYGFGNNVEISNGTNIGLDKTNLSGALGLNYAFATGVTGEAAALYSDAGMGGRASFRTRRANSESELIATYHQGFNETAAGIGSDAARDNITFRHAQRLAQGIWGEAALRVNRYSDDVSEIAKTAGFAASLRYLREFYGWTGGLSYEVEGEYIFDKTLRPDGLGGNFVPLGIRDREIHAASASASAPLSRNLWFDAYGGWAVDRYDGNGPFGGLAVRYTPVAGMELSAGVSHSEVNASQGSSGGVTTGGIALTFKGLGGGAARE
jgi:hypothetical protein